MCDEDKFREEFNKGNNISAAREAFLEHGDQIVKATKPEKLEKPEHSNHLQGPPIDSRNAVDILHWNGTCEIARR